MLTKKMFSVFIALSMAVVLSGCTGVSTTTRVKETVSSRSYEKLSVVVDNEVLAQEQGYQKRIQEQLNGLLTDNFLAPFDKPAFGQEYGNGEVLIVKIRVVSVDEGHRSGLANIQVEASFSDSNGKSLGSVLVAGKNEVSLLGGTFDQAVSFAALRIYQYIVSQFS